MQTTSKSPIFHRYPLVIKQFAIGNDHSNRGFAHKTWWIFHVTDCQRVNQPLNPIKPLFSVGFPMVFRLNLHFPMGFPMISCFCPWFSSSFPMVSSSFPMVSREIPLGERLTRELKNYAPVAAQCDIRVLKSKDQISASADQKFMKSYIWLLVINSD